MGDTTSWRELLAETTAAVGERPAARWLCEVASGADRIEDVLDEPATQRMVAHLDAMLARYRAGEPLAYVLGRWSFRHLDLAVDRRVLIPRPETEVVAGVAIELARTLPPPIVVADLGTGSGAIGLALADELPLDGVTVWLTDASHGRPRPRPGQPRRHRTPRRQRARRRGPTGSTPCRRGRRSTSSWPTRRTSPTGPPTSTTRCASGSRTTPCSPGPTGSTTIRAIVDRRPRPRPPGRLAGAGDRCRPGRGRRRAAAARRATPTSSIRPDLAGRDRVAVGRLP